MDAANLIAELNGKFKSEHSHPIGKEKVER